MPPVTPRFPIERFNEAFAQMDSGESGKAVMLWGEVGSAASPRLASRATPLQKERGRTAPHPSVAYGEACPSPNERGAAAEGREVRSRAESAR
jgi:hypothetical protein